MRQRPKASQPARAKPDVSHEEEEEKRTKSMESRLFSSPKNVFALCLVFRIVNSLLVETYFNPDEHWQALEVAHRLVFGYGQLTWEWNKGIRSYLHPMIFALLYKVLALLGLDTPWLLNVIIYMLRPIFSSVCDFYLYKLSYVIFGSHVAKWALFWQLGNWFMFFCLNCTLSNSLETVLTVVALYYWPCFTGSSHKGSSNSRKWALALAALACAIRPTSAIIWIYVGLLELFVAHDRLRFVILEVVPVGAPDGKRRRFLNIPAKWPSKLQFAILFLLATNIPMALYMSLVHQRGTEDAINYLSNEARYGKVKSAIFLMPCHATPYYSTLHCNLPMRFLDCTPSEERGIQDESDQFMNNPIDFASEYARNWSLPSHVVLFDSEERLL
ncbi:GPI mannosyltransferase 3 isoform X3 [Tripterygium wilfordii]|uniref:Mannosyltransferase n=1 Tax=Tripterygium wilfordii TaxID=458696 RepID=A0A7J7DBY8_TRIWF|nr:GPI mannosyltransferase 3 isoform X3 [Tripterygium wilfordii]